MNTSLTVALRNSARKKRRAANSQALDHVVHLQSKRAISPSRRAAAALASHSRLQRAVDRLEACYAGAVVLHLFAAAPWLQSFELDLSASFEYDDEGGTYRSIWLSVAEGVGFVERVEREAEVFAPGCDEQAAAIEWIDDELSDDNGALYRAFRGDEQVEDLRLVCVRARLEPLLTELNAGGTASGAAAFAALWPEDAFRVS